MKREERHRMNNSKGPHRGNSEEQISSITTNREYNNKPE